MKYKRGNITLSPNHIHNIIVYNSSTYQLEYLRDKVNGSNSFIFKLKDPNGEFEDRIIKFCKYPLDGGQSQKRQARFKREIEALKKAKTKNLKNIIQYCWDGDMEINGRKFAYYVMEKADANLKDYLLENPLDTQEKLKMSRDILNGLSELHEIGIYHRDIKPENILFVGNECKIGDLGLLAHRDEDFDDKNEKIGPYGWLSPEVMNKVMTENEDTEFKFDCKIDDKSDIFQLGKLFWFIFQGNVPIGQIQEDDFLHKETGIFALVIGMIQYSKARRPQMERIHEQFKNLGKKYAI